MANEAAPGRASEQGIVSLLSTRAASIAWMKAWSLRALNNLTAVFPRRINSAGSASAARDIERPATALSSARTNPGQSGHASRLIPAPMNGVSLPRRRWR